MFDEGAYPRDVEIVASGDVVDKGPSRCERRYGERSRTDGFRTAKWAIARQEDVWGFG